MNFKDNNDEYVGNIWGWKFSLFGLALIVFLSGLMIYRHYTLGVPFGEATVESSVESYHHAKADSIRAEKNKN